MLKLPRTLEGRLSILACPICASALEEKDDSLFCGSCRATYPVKNDKIYFIEPPSHSSEASNIKHWLRQRLGSQYKRAVRLFGPGFSGDRKKLLLGHIDPRRSIVIDLGSGTERVHPDVITLDLFDYPEVDIVCDLRFLPFGAGTVDAFTTASVLEHIEDVPALIEKTFRCTRTGGIGIHSFPFLFHFHESPRDFIRYTHMGAASLFRKWNIHRLFNSAGPVTVFLTTTIEFLSSLMSFGNGRVKEATYLGLCALLFPFKYLDKLFVDRPRFLSTSAILCIIAEKPASESISSSTIE